MAQRPTNNSELRCGQRCTLFCCPCVYFNEPKLATTDCCLCCHEIKKEGRLQVPPLIEMSSTWTNSNTPIPIWFIILRYILTLTIIGATIFIFLAVANAGFADLFFIYLTSWLLIISSISMILKSVSTNIIYRLVSNTATYDVTNTTQQQQLYKIQNTPGLCYLYIAQNLFLQVSLPGEILIVVLYWVFSFGGYEGVEFAVIVQDIFLHFIGPLIVLIDFILSAERMYYKGAIWPLLLGVVYTLWTIIFEILGLKDERGNQSIYSWYHWSEGILLPIIVFSIGVALLFGINVLLVFVKNFIIIGSGIGEMNESDDEIDDNVEMGNLDGRTNVTGVEI